MRLKLSVLALSFRSQASFLDYAEPSKMFNRRNKAALLASGSTDLSVALKANGQMEQARTVTVSPGVARPVKFTVSKTRPGTCTVAVGGDIANFTVIAAGSEWSAGHSSQSCVDG